MNAPHYLQRGNGHTKWKFVCFAATLNAKRGFTPTDVGTIHKVPAFRENYERAQLSQGHRCQGKSNRRC
ncbi:hypothetical protein GCM10011410_27570 [Hoyosella rhizosphaerae]|uniref:Uncharacterized protein n=1 Tax=Hoyosella rhizosphaerae TaxID=1755582 RepID=A0A916UJA9_9ACTN|nr:hypothetical protein GCM10011410_27570 [Hoyosella rhizosphaerae]